MVWPDNAKWNGKIYGKPGQYTVYFSGVAVELPDELVPEIQKVQKMREAWGRKGGKYRRRRFYAETIYN